MTYVPDSIRTTEEAPPQSPEQELWRAVLVHAIRDLQAGGPPADAVKRWMLTRGRDEDFRIVCDLAGYNPDAIRRAVVRHIELTDPPSVRDVLLGGGYVSAREFGLPEAEVLAAIDELREEGHTIVRPTRDTYRCQGVRPPPAEPQRRRKQRTQGRAEADDIILSGKPFHAGPAGSYLRARIGTLRQKGFSIKPLGRNGKFICARVSQIISHEAKTSQNSSQRPTVARQP